MHFSFPEFFSPALTMKWDLNTLLLLLGIISTSAGDSDPVASTRAVGTVQFKPLKTADKAQNPNTFSNNLMSAISTRTGAPVHIRVGGTSMDNTIFDAANSNVLTTTGNRTACRLHTNATIGSPWLSAFKNFNPGTLFTVEVPLARRNSVNRITFAEACIAAIPGQTQQLEAIEIGNEPDLYLSFPQAPCGAPDRAKGYGPDDYATEWKMAADNLSEHVGALNGSAEKAWYQAMTLSSGVNQNLWNVYQGDACGTLEDQLMNHSKTVSEMQSAFGAAISFLEKKHTPFVLGEVGSAIGGRNCNPTLEIYRSLGAALWTADFMLHAMAMGIKRVSMQQGTNFNFSSWQPISTKAVPKAVHGNWYGHIFAADFIGSGGDFQIQALSPSAAHPNIVGYAGYNSGRLTKVAVLDLRFWNGVNDAGRPAVDIELANLDGDITDARVSRLSAPGGSSDLTNISWAGQQWNASNNGQEPMGNDSILIKVANGSLAGNVTILASQALLLEMIRA
ncbi:hypothetical protein K438DRAFT_2073502 [Mycena galopus ATCC 62051]|nr:hypothetical protein K438DRAFT_1784397 [Mycena galopus ATCC 62051]KAF8158659.1 hypothetical protein K438DRAFT_2073502 [Mycena galopus ATCC 62051]